MGGATLGALLGLPVLLQSDMRFGWLLLPIVLMTNFFWSLHPGAIPGNPPPNRRVNLPGGRFMAILLGSSFHVLPFGHLMPHRFNRNPRDRPDVYDPAMT